MRRKKTPMVTNTACEEVIVYVCATVHECVARELTKREKKTKTIQCKQITSNVLWFTLTIVKAMTMVSTSWTFYVASVHMLLWSSKQKQDGNICMKARAIQMEFTCIVLPESNVMLQHSTNAFSFTFEMWINKRYTHVKRQQRQRQRRQRQKRRHLHHWIVLYVLVRMLLPRFHSYVFPCHSIPLPLLFTLSQTESHDTTKLYLYTRYTESNE